MSRLALVAFATVTLVARTAGADDNPCPDPGCRIKSSSTLVTEKGSVLKLPPGYFLDDTTFARRDRELREAQDRVTRLVAENQSFRKDAEKFSWAPVVASALSLVGGVIVYSLVK